MAHFFGSIQGSRKPATRTGGKRRGMTAHVRGWNIGVEVVLSVDKDGRDSIEVYETGGSHNSRRVRCVAVVNEKIDK